MAEQRVLGLDLDAVTPSINSNACLQTSAVAHDRNLKGSFAAVATGGGCQSFSHLLPTIRCCAL